MHSLLIVDDEAPIADALEEVMRGLPAPELDVYKAYSGNEALRVLENTRIDIVLSDIRMPEMSGLELLEKIRTRWPQCRVIFLTGYADFDYVYTAIKHEGVSYLLKTDGYDAVIAEVQKAAAEIDDAVKTTDMLHAANEHMSRAKALLRENYLAGIMRGRFSRCEIDKRQFDELDIPLNPEESVGLLVGRIENLPPGMRYSAKIRRLYGVRAVAEHFLRPQTTMVCLIDESPRLVWLLQPRGMADPQAWPACLTYVRGSAAPIQDAAAASLGLVLSFAMDDAPTGWEALPDHLADLAMLLDYHIGRESGMLLADGSGPGQPPCKPLASGMLLTRRASAPSPEAAAPGALARGRALTRARAEQLTEALESGDREGFFGLLDALTAGFAVERDMHDLSMLEGYHAIALALLVHINRRSLIETVAARTGLHKLMNAESHGTWAAARAYLENMGRILFDARQADDGHRARDVVCLVRRHVSDHILEPQQLTLVRLADLVHLNPSYLSRLFKQESGMKLSDHIADMRIVKAKSMLADHDVRIHEVAAALGYGTAANFTRFFKRSVGLTPQEYRDRCPGKGMIRM